MTTVEKMQLQALSIQGLSNEQTREIVTEPLYTDPVVSGDYAIQTDGVHKDVESKILIVGRRSDPLRKVNGCDLPSAEARPVEQRSFVPAMMGYNETFCLDDLNQTVLGLCARNNIRRNDLDATQLGALLMQMTLEENQAHLQKLSWFARKGSNNQKFNQIDGYWELIRQGVQQNEVTRIDDFHNAILGPGQGVDIMRAVFENASDELNGMMPNQKVCWISRAVMQAIKRDVQDGTSGSAAYEAIINNGARINTWDGVELREMSLWESLYSSLFGGIDADKNANLVALSAKQNLTWAINENDGIFEAFYGRESDRFILRSCLTFGAQYQLSKLICVAY